MPTINIQGAGAGGGKGGRRDDLFDLFRRMIDQPSVQTERLFLNLYRARNPASTIFGGGAVSTATSAGGADLRAAAGQLSAAAGRLTAAAGAIAAAARAAGFSAGGGMGGGGGGGGGAGLGGGPGRGIGPGALSRALGSGRFFTGAGLGLALSRLGPLGIGAALGWEALHLPQIIGSLEGSALNASLPWINLSRSTFARGIAGGFPGSELRTQLATRPGQEPAWMKALGVTPDEAADLLQQFGLPLKSAGRSMDVARLLSGYASSPGFANVGLQGVIGAARLGGGYGQQVEPFMKRLSQVMEAAGMRGLDQSKVLSSIEGTLQRIAAAAPGLSIGGLAGFFERMMRSGLPGGLTGEAAQRMSGTLQEVAQNLGTNPLAATVALRGLPSGALTDTGAFRRLMGGPAFDQAMRQPGAKKMFADMQKFARQGNSLLALRLAGQLLQGNPEAMMQVMLGGAGRMTGPGSSFIPFIVSGATGESLSDIYAYQNAPKGGARGAGAAGILHGLNLAAGDFGFASDVDYASALKRAGVPESAIPDLVRAGKATGVDPVLIASYWHAEHSDFSMGGNGPAKGPMGVMGGPTGRYQSFVAGARLIRKFSESDRDVMKARADYSVGPNATWMERVMGEASGQGVLNFLQKAYGIENLPTRENLARADVSQQILEGSRDQFYTVTNNLELFNQGLGKAEKAIDSFADKLRKFFVPTPQERLESERGWEEFRRQHLLSQPH